MTVTSAFHQFMLIFIAQIIANDRLKNSIVKITHCVDIIILSKLQLWRKDKTSNSAGNLCRNVLQFIYLSCTYAKTVGVNLWPSKIILYLINVRENIIHQNIMMSLQTIQRYFCRFYYIVIVGSYDAPYGHTTYTNHPIWIRNDRS